MKKYILILFSVFAFGQSGLIARQNFAYKAVSTGTNTEIGGVAATISTPALLATKLGISVGNISNFSIVGSDIKCKITGGYGIPASAFQLNTAITYFYDYDNLVNAINADAFDRASNLSVLITKGVLSTGSNSPFKGTKLSLIDFPTATSIIGNDCFSDASPNFGNIKQINIRSVTTLGTSSSDNFIFRGMTGNPIIYANTFLQTNNAGAPDGDLTYAFSQGATVRYVTNDTAPNPVTDLSAGTIYNTAIQLNFTPPSSTNAIEYYECWANGARKNNITSNGQYIAGLSASTNYDVSIYAVDIFFNKSLVSNVLNVSTNTTSAVPTTGLVSYYKLDSNSNDVYGSNNGTDTSISYVSGKINNSGSYNGTNSKSVFGNASSLQISTGTISCWIKSASPGASYRFVFGKVTAYGMFLFNGVFGVYSWAGSSGFKSTGINLADGNWHHIAFVFESGTSNNYLYVDGVLKLTTSMTVSGQSVQLTMGDSPGDNQFFNGLIDEANVYNVKLTQSQIQLIYNNGTGTTL